MLKDEKIASSYFLSLALHKYFLHDISRFKLKKTTLERLR